MKGWALCTIKKYPQRFKTTTILEATDYTRCPQRSSAKELLIQEGLQEVEASSHQIPRIQDK